MRPHQFMFILLVALTLEPGCGEIRTHRQIEPPASTKLTTGIGGILFHLNKIGDLPNAFGGRDIWGGKVDKGYAEMRLAGIEGTKVILDILDISRQSTETVMDRYKPFQRNTLVNVDVKNSVSLNGQSSPNQARIIVDTADEKEIVIAGVRVTFVKVQPNSVQYILEDLQH
jgi:hypothetical protein